jgi:hypothetical protein
MQYLAGQTEEALVTLRLAYKQLVELIGPVGPATQDTAFYLASALNDTGHPQEAQVLVDILQPKAILATDPGYNWEARIKALQAQILVHQGRKAEALPMLQAVVRQLRDEKAQPWIIEPLKKTIDDIESYALSKSDRGSSSVVGISK